MRHGLLLLDKPAGCTSHDVVQEVRRVIGEKKVGHCGTLDPDATGLLLLTVGRGTRLTRFLIRAPKVYEGAIRFGQATDTYDASGTVTVEATTDGLTTESVSAAMKLFEGEIDQQPPPYCAKKVGGVRFYELARRGQEVPLKTKRVHVYDFSAAGELEGDRLRFRLRCASGTYARSLAHELGQRLGSAAHLVELRRHQIGSFKVEDALTIAALATALAEDRSTPAFIPFDDIPLPFESIRTDPQQEKRITHGQTVLVKDARVGEGDWVKVINGHNEFVAVGAVIECLGPEGVRVVQPKIVFK